MEAVKIKFSQQTEIVLKLKRKIKKVKKVISGIENIDNEYYRIFGNETERNNDKISAIKKFDSLEKDLKKELIILRNEINNLITEL
jgi:hypothetical protein